MKTVKIAVVGCGHWGKNLARNFAELGALKVVIDPNPQTAQTHAKMHGVEAVDMATALADPEISGLVIAAPAELHKDLALQVIAAGKHVYVEKPLALSVADGEIMRDAANKAGVLLMVGHLLQYHPVFAALREMVKAGDLGKLRYAYSHRLSMGKFRLEEDAFWSLAPHDVSMILALFGEAPTKVSGAGLDFITPGIADEARLDMSFSSGGRAHIFASWLHPFKEQKLVVVGEKAMAVFDDTVAWENKLALYKHKVDMSGPVPVPVKADVEYIGVPNGEPLKSECQHFLDCIKSGQTPLTDAEEALRVLRVLEVPQLPST
ncbi:MAG: oxidoreductase [Robiginitomaculum sp.]|nr:MAG: oxidoreductase [Robiginitomaculum sp.]